MSDSTDVAAGGPAEVSAGRKTGRGPRSRRAGILELLRVKGELRIEELSEFFGVSPMTIHRDLDTLAGAGKVVRVRGGARLSEVEFAERDVTIRQATNRDIKSGLAREAATLLLPGDIVALDDSTTVAMLAPYVVAAEPAGIITHSLGLMRRLGKQPGVLLTGLGGRYVGATDSFLGASTCRAMEPLGASISFVSTTCITDGGLYHPDEDAAMTKTAFSKLGKRRVLVADSSKFDNFGMHFVAHLSEFDHIVMDDNLDDEQREILSAADAEVHLVSTPVPQPTVQTPSLLY